MNLSSIEQSSRLRGIYTQLCFCYSYPDCTEGNTQKTHLPSQDEITSTLRVGLHRLTASFTWIAGQVRSDEDGRYKVFPLHQTPRLAVKDLSSDSSMPTMKELRDANFPFSMLPEEEICPIKTLNGKAGGAIKTDANADDESRPVFILQVNFVRGGILLCILAVHSVMDIVGQGQMISLLSRACRGESFTHGEIWDGNMDRRHLIPLLDNVNDKTMDQNDDGAKNASSRSKTQGNPTPIDSPLPPTLEWAYFTFDPDSLAKLKADAKPPPASEDASSSTSAFISTDDAVCALLWRTIGSARLARLPPSTTSTFTRQVDMRRHMNIPTSYPGNMVTQTIHTLTLKQLTASSLADTAMELRTALDPPSLTRTLRAHATAQARPSPAEVPPSKSSTASKDRSRNVVMSSWSKIDCSGVDFGLGLGRPEAIRRPRFTPLEGVVYLLPKASHGELVAGLCLRDSDMEYLKQDEGFSMYARYIG